MDLGRVRSGPSPGRRCAPFHHFDRTEWRDATAESQTSCRDSRAGFDEDHLRVINAIASITALYPTTADHIEAVEGGSGAVRKARRSRTQHGDSSSASPPDL